LNERRRRHSQESESDFESVGAVKEDKPKFGDVHLPAKGRDGRHASGVKKPRTKIEDNPSKVVAREAFRRASPRLKLSD